MKKSEVNEFFYKLDSAMDVNNQIGFIMETDTLLEKLLRYGIVAKKAINNLRRKKGKANVQQFREQMSKRPLWRLLTDSYIFNILSREQIQKINKLRKKCDNIIKRFNIDDKPPQITKTFYNDWTEIFRDLIKKNNNLRREFKRISTKNKTLDPVLKAKI